MGAAKFIAAFAVAWICVLGNTAVSLLLTIVTTPLLRKSRVMHVVSHFVYDLFAGSISVYIVALVCGLIRAEVTWLMILLPGLFRFSRNLKRLQEAVAGVSEVSYVWRKYGSVKYSQSYEILMELGRLTGAVLGLVAGMLLFAKNAAFW